MTNLSLTFKRLVRGWGTNHIVALYMLIGSAWILLSDRIAVFNAPDPATAAIFSTVKGLGYVAVTAVGLHWLINRHTAALRESETRFRIIFEHANDAIHIDTADDEILDVNPRMCELMGYTRDELLAMRIPDLQAPEIRAAGNVIVTELARYGGALFEGLNLHRSGQRIPVEISIARVARPQGDLYVSVLRDITERKRAEEALRDSEDQFRSLVEQSPLSIQRLAPDGRTVQINHAFETLWGLTLEDLTNYNILADQQLVQLGLMPYIQRAFSGEAASIPAAEYDPGASVGMGTKKWVQARIYPVKDDAGDIRQVILIHENITDRKQRERELAAIAAIAMALRAASTRDDMLPIIGQQVSGLLQTDSIALFVREMTTDEALFAFAKGIGSEFAGIRIPKGQGIVGRVLETGRPYLAQDVEHDPLVYRRDALTGLRAIGCVPLIAQDRIIGALWVGRTTTITEDEVRVLAAIGDIAANALHRAEVLETLEQRVYDRTRELAEANERLTELDR